MAQAGAWTLQTNQSRQLWTKSIRKMAKEVEFFDAHGLKGSGDDSIIKTIKDIGAEGRGNIVTNELVIDLAGAGLTGATDSWSSGLQAVYNGPGTAASSTSGADAYGNVSQENSTWGVFTDWATDTGGYGKLPGREESIRFETEQFTVGRKRTAIRKYGRWVDVLIRDRFREQGRRLLSNWKSNWETAYMMQHLCGNTNWTWNATALSPTTHTNDNLNRLLYGGTATSTGSLVEGHTFGLLEIDRMVELAKTAVPIMKPHKTKDGQDWYMIVLHPYTAAALRQDDEWKKACYHAQDRGDSNPLFKGSIGEWNGCTIHEHRYVPIFNNGGPNGNLPYSNSILLGAGAACFAESWFEYVEDATSAFADYGNRPGLGLDFVHGIKKTQYDFDGTNAQDMGVITMQHYCAKLSGASAI